MEVIRLAVAIAALSLANFAASKPPKSGFYAVEGYPQLEEATEVCGISADGDVALGYAHGSAGRRAVSWSPAGGKKLGDYSWTMCRMSGGMTVFDAQGKAVALVDVPEDRLRWTRSVGVMDAPSLPLGPYSNLWVFAVSADGKTFAGNGTRKEGTEAFRCVAGKSPEGLGDLPGGFFYSQANAISPDGEAVVGVSRSFDGPQAFLWTKAAGIKGLGMLPGKCHATQAECVSKGGKAVGGTALTDSGAVAFLWSGGKIVALGDRLKGAGIAVPAGWKLQEALCISDDGLVVAGNGVDPTGKKRGWVAVLPPAK